MFTSSLRFDGVRNTRWSIFSWIFGSGIGKLSSERAVSMEQRTLSTPFPNNSRRTQLILVFLPAPDGPYTSKWGKSPEFAYQTSVTLGQLYPTEQGRGGGRWRDTHE